MGIYCYGIKAGVRLLIEGSSYSRAAFVYFGGIPLRRSGGILL